MSTARTFGEAFHGKRTQLIQYTDVGHGLLDRLLDADVITKSQKQDIDGQSSESGKLNRLFDILERRPDHLYPYFCHALDIDGQSHITDILRRPSSTSGAGGGSTYFVPPQASSQFYGPAGYQSQGPQNPYNYSNLYSAGFPHSQSYNTAPPPEPAPAPAPSPGPAPGPAPSSGPAPSPAPGPAPGPTPTPQSSQPGADQDAEHVRLRTEIIPPDVTMVPADQLSNLHKIAEGGFGIIYRAIHVKFGTVAFKKLKDAVINPKTGKELQKEAQAQCLRHRNIVQILGIVFELGNYGVVMEYAMYGGLDDFIETYTVDIFMRMSLAHGVVQGMNYLHTYTKNDQPSPVIHGDLKMQNVLVALGYIPKICDFGLSKWKKFSTTKTNAATMRGTVTHIPPETWKNINLPRDTKYDVYSFGILVYELLSGKTAFAQAIGNTQQIRDAVTSGQRPDMADITSDEPDADVIIKEITDRIPTFWAPEPGERPEFSDIQKFFDDFMLEYKTKVAISRANLDEEM